MSDPISRQAQDSDDSLITLESKDNSPEATSIFSEVEELYIAGGGGAGRALPAAISEAIEHGLDLDNVKVI